MTTLAPAIGWNPWATGNPCRVTLYLGDVFNPTPTTFRGTVQRVRQVLPGIRHVLVTIDGRERWVPQEDVEPLMRVAKKGCEHA